MKRENGFYWVKWKKDAEWEVAKYDSETDKFKYTNGSFQDNENVFEIDEKMIVRN
jgi:hypothetical protein